MENINKKELKTQLMALISRYTTDNFSKEEVAVFFANSLNKLLKSTSKEELEANTAEILKSIRGKQFSAVDFDLNNIILGRTKGYYVSIPFGDKYRSFYFRIMNMNELLTNEQQMNHDFDDKDKFFYKKVFPLKDVKNKLEYSHLLNNLEPQMDEHAMLEIANNKNFRIDNFVKMLFIGFLLTNRKYKSVVKDFIIDLMSLELFFINIKIFNYSDFIFLNQFCSSLIDICCLEDFGDRLLDLLDDKMADEKIVLQLSKLILHVFFVILKNSSKQLVSRLIDENVEKEDQESYLHNIKHLKKELLFFISNPTETEGNHKYYTLLYGLFKHVFNVSNLSLIVFDSTRFAKFKSKTINRNGTTIVLYEEKTVKSIIVFDDTHSRLLLNNFMKYSFDDFKEDTAEEFKGKINRVT